MTPNGEIAFITEDDMGEGWTEHIPVKELEDKLEIEQRKFEHFRRIKENKTIR